MPVPNQKLAQAQGLLQQGKVAEAKAAYQGLARTYANEPEVVWGLGRTSLLTGDNERANFFARKLAAMHLPGEGWQYQAAKLLQQCGLGDEVVAFLEQHIARAGGVPGSGGPTSLQNLLLETLYYLRKTAKAKQLCSEMITTADARQDRTASAQLHGMMASLYRSEGRVRESIEEQKIEVAGQPELAEAALQASINSLYDDRATAADVTALHRRYGELAERDAYAERIGPAVHAERDDPGRALRIGFMSPDFMAHSVAHFALPLIEGLRARGWYVACFHTGNREDAYTAKFKKAASSWRVAWSFGPRSLAGAVMDEKVDVLVDLAGLSLGSGIGAAHYRPAPVQMTYLGYPATTGVRSMGYRIVDAVTDPASPEFDAQCVEKLIRLDRCFLCFRPLEEPPAPKDPSTASPANAVRFGSFNILTKVNDSVMDTWSEILRRVPGSTLTLKSGLLNDESVRAWFVGQFVRRGVEAGRIQPHAWHLDMHAHQRMYHELDIALDPFPYHGTTTTCEVLMMGVPVVTLEGDRHASRVGCSLLRAVGREDLIATSREQYIALACDLAADVDRRRGLHAAIPRAFAQSALRDEAGFVTAFEGAVRAAWRERCGVR